jgi:hypothetical protein
MWECVIPGALASSGLSLLFIPVTGPLSGRQLDVGFPIWRPARPRRSAGPGTESERNAALPPGT